jgi:hypothetical protein
MSIVSTGSCAFAELAEMNRKHATTTLGKKLLKLTGFTLENMKLVGVLPYAAALNQRDLPSRRVSHRKLKSFSRLFHTQAFQSFAISR